MKMPTLPKSVKKVANQLGNALDITTLNQFLIVILAIFVIRKTVALYTPMDLIVLIVLFIIGKTLNLSVVLSFAWASIITGLYILIVKPSYIKIRSREGFDDMATNAAPKKSKKTKKTKKPGVKSVKMDFKEEEAKESFQLDTKRTEEEILKGLDKKEVKGLTNDTKELIDTQKQLMELLNQMGPALKDGKQILSTFQNYFGNDVDLRGSK